MYESVQCCVTKPGFESALRAFHSNHIVVYIIHRPTIHVSCNLKNFLSTILTFPGGIGWRASGGQTTASRCYKSRIARKKRNDERISKNA